MHAGKKYLLARSSNYTAAAAAAVAYCQLQQAGSKLGSVRAFTLPRQFASQVGSRCQ